MGQRDVRRIRVLVSTIIHWHSTVPQTFIRGENFPTNAIASKGIVASSKEDVAAWTKVHENGRNVLIFIKNVAVIVGVFFCVVDFQEDSGVDWHFLVKEVCVRNSLTRTYGTYDEDGESWGMPRNTGRVVIQALSVDFDISNEKGVQETKAVDNRQTKVEIRIRRR